MNLRSYPSNFLAEQVKEIQGDHSAWHRVCTQPLQHSCQARHGMVGRHVGGSSGTCVPAPRSPLLLGRSRRAPGWQQIRAILLSCLWSPWLCSEYLSPHSCALGNLGRAGITCLCLLETPTQCPRSHVGGLPCLVGHSQESNCLSPLLHIGDSPAGICSLAAPLPPWQFGNLAFHRDGGPQRAHGALHLAGL